MVTAKYKIKKEVLAIERNHGLGIEKAVENAINLTARAIVGDLRGAWSGVSGLSAYLSFHGSEENKDFREIEYKINNLATLIEEKWCEDDPTFWEYGLGHRGDNLRR